MKFCINCGKQLDDQTAFCPYCGCKAAPPKEAQPETIKGCKGPALAAFLLFSGLNLIYFVVMLVRSLVLYSNSGVLNSTTTSALIRGNLPSFIYLLFAIGLILLIFLLRKRRLQDFKWTDTAAIGIFVLISIIIVLIMNSIQYSFALKLIYVSITYGNHLTDILLPSVFNCAVMMAIYFLRKSGAKTASIIITVAAAFICFIIGIIAAVASSSLLKLYNVPDAVMIHAVTYTRYLFIGTAIEHILLLVGTLLLAGCRKPLIWGGIGIGSGFILKIVLQVISLAAFSVQFKWGATGFGLSLIIGMFGVMVGFILVMIGRIMTAASARRL